MQVSFSTYDHYIEVEIHNQTRYIQGIPIPLVLFYGGYQIPFCVARELIFPPKNKEVLPAFRVRAC